MTLKHLLFSSLMLLSAGTAWADVRISAINFPDANFRSYLTSQPYGSDGLLTDAEIAEIKILMLSSKNIQNLNGIKNFTALQYLSCDGNQLTSLDVSGCESLIELDCSNNKLTSLDVSGCTALTSIICAQNQLKGNAVNDLIESLPTTQDGGLYIINVESDGNAMNIDQVKRVNAKGWIAYALDEKWNEYTGGAIPIDEENFPDGKFRNYLLSQSYGSDGKLTGEEIAGVTEINVFYNGIQSLKGIELFTALTTLSCGLNQLTSLDVSKNTALTWLECDYNQLTSLDVSKNTKLTTLSCDDNQLTSLDVSGCTALTLLWCSRNQLTSLDVSKNTALRELFCYQNRIKGAAMDALVASLPTVSSREMQVIYNKNEQNVMTTTQVAAAKAKGWTAYANNGAYWYEYPGSSPVTGVNNVEASDADDSAPWYTINGTLLSGKPTETGIYIHNGKKVVVK